MQTYSNIYLKTEPEILIHHQKYITLCMSAPQPLERVCIFHSHIHHMNPPIHDTNYHN